MIQPPHRKRDGGAVGFLLGILGEAAGADVQPAIVFVTTVEEAANFLADHLPLAMLGLHDDARVFERRQCAGPNPSRGDDT